MIRDAAKSPDKRSGRGASGSPRKAARQQQQKAKTRAPSQSNLINVEEEKDEQDKAVAETKSQGDEMSENSQEELTKKVSQALAASSKAATASVEKLTRSAVSSSETDPDESIGS